MDRETRVVGLQLASRLTGGLEKHRIALQQIASFFENSEEVTEEEFQQFAAATLGLSPLCLRISFVDASLRVRWVHPKVHMATLADFDVRTHPEGLETLLRARDTRTTALSASLKLVGGMPGFVLTAPIFRNGEFFGAVVCSFQSDSFFDSMILSEVLERYEEAVFDAGTQLFLGGTSGEGEPGMDGFVEEMEVAGRNWTVRVRPRPEVEENRLASGQMAFWVMGGLLTLLAGTGTGVTYLRVTGMAARLETNEAVLEQTREKLDQATQQLLQAEKLSALGELVAGVAHEMNNPLSAILGYSQLMLRQDWPADATKRLWTIHSEAERAGKIVRNLLTFARKHPPEKKYASLNEVIEQTLELKAYQLRVNQIEVIQDLAPGLPRTMLDAHQIQQILLNLLNNAEQAMQETGEGGTIRVGTRRVGDRIQVRVTDSGPGIPAEIRSRIFEPFFTTKKEGKGTGLGLSLCYGIANEHGGEIRVEDTDERGATFVLELPILKQAEVRAVRAASAPTEPARPLTVLAIDDEPTVLGFLVELLSLAGHKVDTATDVTQALSKIRSGRYDLIISDMKMPGGSGMDIHRAVAQKSPDLARRMVFTTGDGASRDTVAFIRESDCQMLLKPYKLEQIEQVIATAVHEERPS